MTSAAAKPFALVYEIGFGNFSVVRFADENEAKASAATFWCCWCLFRQRTSGELDEIATGGVGLEMTRSGIRRFANETLNPLAVGVAFKSRRDGALGDDDIAASCRTTFGIVYPAGLGIHSQYMFFDKEKAVDKIITAAASRANLVLDKGKLAGSPDRLNLFTLDGDLVRLDLEVEAHLGSTLHDGDVIVMEKGNRIAPNRLQAIREVLSL